MPSIPTVAPQGEQLFYNLIQRIFTFHADAQPFEDGYFSSHGLEPRKLGSNNSQVNLTDSQRHTIQVVATTMASLSAAAAVLALYWFSMMRRNFRRDLVVLLIISDLFKNFCYILYSSVSLTQGQVEDAGMFCQASGYMLQTGLEACDFAVFFISLHMALQIFPLPNTIIGYDGLYHVRYLVFALWFILPNLTASLAFINDGQAYQIQGAWCWLPVRPFWYRLALAWIPRYIITIAIFCFAITIYVHVGTEFRLFGRERDRASSNDLGSSSQPTQQGATSTANTSVMATLRDQESIQDAPVPETLPIQTSRPSTASQQGARELRRYSMPAWTSPFNGEIIDDSPLGSRSAATSRRGSRQVAFNLSEEPLSPLQRSSEPGRLIPPSLRSDASLRPISLAEDPIAVLPVLEEAKTNATLSANSALDAAMRTRQRAIRRQVRGLFIYPVAYMLFWIFPFVGHCMNYSDYYAAHPVFGISLTMSFCTTTLGLVDVIIFSWREQPWRHITGSDGTFFGSLCLWRFQQLFPSLRRTASARQEQEKSLHSSSSGLLSFLKDLTWRRLSSSAGTHTSSTGSRRGPRSGGADSKVREREVAHQRLQMERNAFDQRQIRTTADTDNAQPSAVGGRNWFDNIMELDDDTMMKSRRPTWSGH